MAAKLRPVVSEMRLDAERAITLLAEARAAQAELENPEALDAMELGARRIDFIGLKFQAADDAWRSTARRRRWPPTRAAGSEVSDDAGNHRLEQRAASKTFATATRCLASFTARPGCATTGPTGWRTTWPATIRGATLGRTRRPLEPGSAALVGYAYVACGGRGWVAGEVAEQGTGNREQGTGNREQGTRACGGVLCSRTFRSLRVHLVEGWTSGFASIIIIT